MINTHDNSTFLRRVLPEIISWYRQNKKPLPWREDATPYHVWISEIMLQQTRIEAALNYYKRFLQVLPSVEALAAVEDEHLMKLWQGLGYYSRARNLKKAAVAVVEKHGGVLPDDVKALRALPGIGDYTAGAIASIAYGKPEPAVDGNVLRVMSRILAYDDDIMLQGTKKEVMALLASVYPSGKDASYLTEGLMELGELVCIPNGEPRCEECPVRMLCRAKKQDMTAFLPVRNARKEKRHEDKTVLLLRTSDGRYAINKRGPKGLLADMWEFPCLDGIYAEGDVESYLAEHGISISGILPCGETTHIFTHVLWKLHGFYADVENEGEDFLFVTPEEIRASYAIPSAYRFYLKQLN